MLDGCTPWPEEFADRYWLAGHWRGNTLDNLLRGWALEYGPRTALVHDGARITYAALNRRVDRMAAGFRLRGLRAGQRVVVQLPNVPEFVTTVFALMRIGVVPALCPLPYGASDVPYLVRVTQAVGYVGPATYQGFDHTAMAADIASQDPFLRRVFTLEAPDAPSPYGGGLTTDPAGCHYSPLDSIDAPPERALAQSAAEVALLLLSGERAGPPRLVPRTHNDYAYQARAAAEAVSLTERDVYLAALPAAFNSAFGCPGIVGTLSVGGAVVLADDPGPAECLALIGRERVTVTSVPVAGARLWLDVLPSVEVDLSSLRLVQTGGATPDSPDRETIGRLGPELGCHVQQVFGAAEGPVTLTRPTGPGESALGDDGRPLSPDDEIRIVDADGKDVPDGRSGELLARGPYMPRGHYRAPDRDARSFTADGYFRTGSLARRTPHGTFVITGRLDAVPAGRAELETSGPGPGPGLQA